MLDDTIDQDPMVVIDPAQGEWTPRELPIFTGLVEAMAASAVSESLERMAGRAMASSLVQFAVGSHTVLHTHDGDQILIITAGEGHVGIPGHDHRVGVGTVLVIPAGVPHYHGACADTSMTHLTMLFGSRTTLSDKPLTWPPEERAR